MPLLGTAAVAMWWTIAAGDREEFRQWHSKEHFPERMGIPGFRRGSRWEREDDSGAHFVIYELDDYATLTSDGYRASLNNPTPWSRRMMPLHHGIVRSQCRIAASHGAGVATYMVTLTLSPREGEAEKLRQFLDGVLEGLPRRPGITGAHLLLTDTPRADPTTEQKIRGGDAVADWIVLVSGFGREGLDSVFFDELGLDRIGAAGGHGTTPSGPFRLVHAVTPQDFQPATK
jgi:hypothetical protein